MAAYPGRMSVTAGSPVDLDAVRAALAKVDDPEIRRPVTELDMVKDVQVDGGIVRVDLYLTVPGCPMKDRLTTDVKAAVGAVPGVPPACATADAGARRVSARDASA